MTDTFATPFTIAPLAPLAPTSAPALEGSIPSRPVGSDWSATKRDGDAKERVKRRSAIERARHSVEAGWIRPGQLTKAERLAASRSKGTRDTGSELERRDTRSSVRRAMEKLDAVPSDADFALSRKDRDDIRSRWGDVGEFIKRSEQWDKEFRADPIQTREKILAAYAGVNPRNFADSAEPEKEDSVRGSIRQAQREHADIAKLQQYEARYGKAFPAIVAQLNQFDKDLAQDPAGVSARLAANAGAPVTEAQARVYEAKQAAERVRQQHASRVNREVESIIANVPGMGDEAMLNAIADLLENPKFPRSGNHVDDLGHAFATVMARHAIRKDGMKANATNAKSLHAIADLLEDKTFNGDVGHAHASVKARGANGTRQAAAATAGSKSISGGPSTAGDPGRDRSGGSRTAVGAAVSRAFGKS